MARERFVNPSRADAWDMTRTEKCSLTYLANAASTLVDAKKDLADRLGRIEGGTERMNMLADECVKLLTEVRMTIPERQRTSLSNTVKDFEMRMVPKMTPSKTNVIVEKEDFRSLVDAAQYRCKNCADLNAESRNCDLFRLLQVILPLEGYDSTILCPYNRAEWEN